MPLWRDVTVHPDHHVSVQYALYSALSTTCPPGTKLEARCDRALVKLYLRGDLVKVHPRKPKGGRSTDPNDYPPERTAYAMRAPDRIVSQAVKLGPTIGHFAERLLKDPSPGPNCGRARSCCAWPNFTRPSDSTPPAPGRWALTWSTCGAWSASWSWRWSTKGNRRHSPTSALTSCRLAASLDLGSAFDHRFAVTQETKP